jgi:hypothetical protein
MSSWAPLAGIIFGSCSLVGLFIYLAITLANAENYNAVKTNIIVSSVLNILFTIIFMLGIGFHISGDPTSANRIMLFLIGVAILLSLSSLTIALLDKAA